MRSRTAPDLLFRPRGTGRGRAFLCAMVAAIAAAGGCERTTSVGSIGHSDGSTSTAAELCTSTGGGVATQSCCASVTAFPDTCSVGACGCSPSSSALVAVCDCRTGCFLAGSGCAGAPGVCTAGVDSSCNQDSSVTTPLGRCVAGNRCVCFEGATLSDTGRCL